VLIKTLIIDKSILYWKWLLLSLIGLFFLFLYHVSNYNAPYTVNYDIKIIQNEGRWLGEIYYSDDNSSYHSKSRKQIRYQKDRHSFQSISVNLYTSTTIRNLRLDPLLTNGLIEVKNFSITHLGQTYNIDLSKLRNNTSNNINILKCDKQTITIESIGTDPFIELSNAIYFDRVNRHIVWQALKYTVLVLLLLLLVFLLAQYSVFQTSILFAMLFLYTVYTLLYLNPALATLLLISSSFIAVLLTLLTRPSNVKKYMKSVGIFVFLYGLIGYLSLWNTTEMANANYYYEKIPYIMLASIFPLGFYHLKNFNVKWFKILLTSLLAFMATMIILLDHNLLILDNITMLDFLMKRTYWTQKNYMFWYVLLMFGTLAFYNPKNKVDFLMVFCIVVVSYFVVFGGYSLSARLSYGAGLALYIILFLFQIKKRHLFIIIWIFTFYIIFSPILFALIDFTFLPKLVERDAIYKTSLALIQEHWFFGYGYGSTLQLHINDFVSTVDLPKHYLNKYPGGHPHNLSLLFWLEFGLVGASFLAYYIHKLLVFIIEYTYGNTHQAAILSLIVSFDVITSFSWSIWYPQVLLTFAFFGIMLVLAMNIKVKRGREKIWEQN